MGVDGYCLEPGGYSSLAVGVVRSHGGRLIVGGSLILQLIGQRVDLEAVQSGNTHHGPVKTCNKTHTSITTI